MNNKQHSDVTDADVAHYLTQTPDFFARHVDLLRVIKVPHPSGGAISLVERQMVLMREENAALQAKLKFLAEIAADNQRITDQIYGLALSLVTTNSLEEVIDVTKHYLVQDFGLEFASLMFFAGIPNQNITVVNELEREKYFSDWLSQYGCVCADISSEQLTILFGEYVSTIESSALVPLSGMHCYGVIGLGSTDALRFSNELGVYYLEKIGLLVSAAMARHLPESIDGAATIFERGE